MENIENNSAKVTTPYCEETQPQNIDCDTEQPVTPNDETCTAQDIARDTGEPAAQSTVSENLTAPEPFITVQYNHQNRNFTKQEAINLIQKGMHTESLRAKLEYLAKIKNTDVNSLVENIVSAPEADYKNMLEKMYGSGSDEVEIGLKIYREKQSDEYKKLITEQEKGKLAADSNADINLKLADQYINLKQEMPNAPDYCNLPNEVIIEAASGKKDLFSAYLCYLYKEQNKINAAQKTQKTASEASLGEMRSGGDTMSSAEKSFLNGLWSK